MAREPDLVIFRCESCDEQLEADARKGNHLLRWKRALPIEANGRCRSCGGESWTISVVFAQSGLDVNQSALGIGLMATTGVGFVQSSTATNQADYPNVPAAIVAKLNEVPQERLQRVAAFATTMERERLKQQGARACATCGALFMSTPDKPWTEKGFCSKVCSPDKEHLSEKQASLKGEPPPKSARAQAIPAQCPAGHEFEVPLSFAGLTRPCPKCGRKTAIPLG